MRGFRRRPVETQERMFRRLLRRGRLTEFGDRYDLRHIRSVEQFNRVVGGLELGQTVTLLVLRGETQTFVPLRTLER